MLIKMNCANGGGGGSALYAEGSVPISTSANTPITTVDVNTGVPFKPKTIIYNTKTTGITNYVSVTYDEDNTEIPDSANKQVCILNNANMQLRTLEDTNARGFLYSVDDTGFTCDKTVSSYGNTCTYKAWG